MTKSKKEPSPEQLNGLRRQIQEWRQNRTEQALATGLVKPTFVQLPATIAPAETLVAPTTIEITARDGVRMRIHLEAGHGTEAASIVAAFLGSRA